MSEETEITKLIEENLEKNSLKPSGKTVQMISNYISYLNYMLLKNLQDLSIFPSGEGISQLLTFKQDQLKKSFKCTNYRIQNFNLFLNLFNSNSQH